MKDIITKLATTTANPSEYIGNDTTGNTYTLNDSIITIINAIIGVLGLVCVVVIILGGFSYMTSSGDAGKVKKAKDTILYAVIGLIVCILAFAIVNFVISNIINGGA